MNERHVIGLTPWLPWPLSRGTWWTEPLRAEHLAALRIGVGLVLLLDVLGTYWPRVGDFFGHDSLGAPGVLTAPVGLLDWHRSFFFGMESPLAWKLLLLAWASAAVCLMFGVWPRVAALACWLLSLSVVGVNDYLHNGGDRVRSILLFYLMLCPCGAAWSVESWWKGRQGPVYVPAWPLRLLFVQLVLIYFFNGVYKLLGGEWQAGGVMHYIVGNLAWSRWSSAQMPMPALVLQLLTWLVLVWEVGFPLLVLIPTTRTATLLLGAAFHIGTGLMLQLGPFPLYMLCLYLPLIPWGSVPTPARALFPSRAPASLRSE